MNATSDPVVRISVAAAVLMLVGMVAAGAEPPPPARAVAEPSAAAVGACPGGPGDVQAAAVAAAPGQTGGLAIAALSGAELAAADSPAVPLRAQSPPEPSVGSAVDGAAPGFTVEQSQTVEDGPLRGLAAASCTPPGSRFWFAGGAAAVGRISELILVNPDTTSAAVDVVLHGPNGRIDAPAGIGVPVAAGGRTAIRLDSLATGLQNVAVEVVARTGRVSAALWEQQVSGSTRQGVDWVPVTAPPGRTQLVPGVFAGGTATLLVAAPGERQAVVAVEFIGADGPFTPVGLDAITVPAASTVAVPLDPARAGAAIGVRITSDEPVVAGVRLVRDSGGREFAYAGATAAIGGPAAVLLRPGTTSSLLVVAPESDATVEIASVTGDGQRSTRRVSVPAGTSVPVGVAAPVPAALVLTPAAGSGPIYAARLMTATADGVGLISVTSVVPRPTTALVPVTSADPAVGFPGH